jgi:uncharacterized protein YegL
MAFATGSKTGPLLLRLWLWMPAMSFDSASVRRLPVYLLLDCSGSMAGEPIAALEMGLKALMGDLHNDPNALDTVWISVITFASTAQVVVPLTDVHEFRPPELTAGGTTSLGEAMDLLAECITAEVRTTGPTRKGDWKPLAFILTDGEPTDDWERSAENFNLRGLATVIACGAGPEVNDETLRRLGTHVVRLKDTKPGTLGAFMKWVSASVTTTSQGLGTQGRLSDRLARPPEDDTIQLVQ